MTRKAVVAPYTIHLKRNLHHHPRHPNPTKTQIVIIIHLWVELNYRITFIFTNRCLLFK